MKQMSDANEKELSVFGFAKGMRAGLITFILSLQTVAIVYLFIALSKSNSEKQELQAKLYEKMIDFIRPTRDKMEETIKRVDTAVVKVTETALATDSLNNSRSLNQKSK